MRHDDATRRHGGRLAEREASPPPFLGVTRVAFMTGTDDRGLPRPSPNRRSRLTRFHEHRNRATDPSTDWFPIRPTLQVVHPEVVLPAWERVSPG